MQCPNCGDKAEMVVDRKALVTSLGRCATCRLLFRQPHTTPAESRRFYQNEYTQGYTTDVPGAESLRQSIATEFKGTERDYSRHLRLFAQLGVLPPARVLEFGCSWGYGAWQMARAGYQVTALEVSAPRCDFARTELGVQAVEDLTEIEGTFDLVFSSHVLEHVDRLGDVISRLWQMTRPGGWMIHLTPNGSAEYAAAEYGNWHQLWGQVHPQLPDTQFWKNWFGSEPFYVSATPVEKSVIADWDPATCGTGRLDTGELLVLARKR